MYGRPPDRAATALSTIKTAIPRVFLISIVKRYAIGRRHAGVTKKAIAIAECVGPIVGVGDISAPELQRPISPRYAGAKIDQNMRGNAKRNIAGPRRRVYEE